MTKKWFHLRYRDGILPVGKVKIFEGLYESEYTAKQDFQTRFSEGLNSTGINQHQLLDCRGYDLPDLTQSEIRSACELFPQDENPVQDFQIMKLRRGLK